MLLKMRGFRLGAIVAGLLLSACGGDDGTEEGEELSASQCSDGKDNDGDGDTDCEDIGCRSHDFCESMTMDAGGGRDGGGGTDAGNGTDSCTPNCAARECGDDGCGGTCGSCPAGTSCSGGACECTPDCAGRECGDDGCGGTCGPGCDEGYLCADGACDLDSDSQWDIFLIDGTVEPGSWDCCDGPDVFVRTWVDDTSPAAERLPPSSTQDNTHEPVWNEVIVSDVTAAEIQSVVRFEVWDEDGAFNDMISRCPDITGLDASAFGGDAQMVDCGPATLRYRVQRP